MASLVHCHCSRCRTATGTGHATKLFTAPENLEWLSGESEVQRYDLPSAQSFAVCFCRSRGSPLPHLTRTVFAWVLVAHLFNHQAHHRGQLTTLLSQMGHDPGVTDLPFMPGIALTSPDEAV